ncbi:MAG: M20/M25/M40 family metallo-hydrolase [Actinomycetota bacterium]|nr:M20/M25/M40 family metallo-hydrolase [Actinomycetota bacterium]
MSATYEELRAQLAELIAIPSVSADPAHAGDVETAAVWVADKIRAAGGSANVVPWNGGRPLVIGEIAASQRPESSPTVLCYAHFDVQPPDPLDLWESPPFELTERDGWLYARGVADDKAQLLMLVEAARGLASAGELPVNVRFALDSEEEVGGQSIIEWVAADEGNADAAIVFDGGLEELGVPTFNTALRGLCYFHVSVRTGERDLHSGLFGGVALNATHALMQSLSAVVAENGGVPEQLRIGVVPPTPEEIEGWRSLAEGSGLLEGVGARPSDAGALDEYYVRTWAEPSVDVHGIAGGSPDLVKTVLPVEARANVSIRIAPGQNVADVSAAFERLLREAAPEGAEVEATLQSSAEPGLVSPDAPALGLAREAFEQVFGRPSLLVRVGGSVPVVASLVTRGIPTISTGIASHDANAHSPNEKFPADYLVLGVEALRETYKRLGELG